MTRRFLASWTMSASYRPRLFLTNFDYLKWVRRKLVNQRVAAAVVSSALALVLASAFHPPSALLELPGTLPSALLRKRLNLVQVS